MFKFLKKVFGKKDVVVLSKNEYSQLMYGIQEILVKINELYTSKLTSDISSGFKSEANANGFVPTYMDDTAGKRNSFTRTT